MAKVNRKLLGHKLKSVKSSVFEGVDSGGGWTQSLREGPGAWNYSLSPWPNLLVWATFSDGLPLWQ